jgi:hypothetical protein
VLFERDRSILLLPLVPEPFFAFSSARWRAPSPVRHLLVGGGAAERLGAKDVWVSRVERKDLTPGALSSDLGPVDADALHRLAPRRFAILGPVGGRPFDVRAGL